MGMRARGNFNSIIEKNDSVPAQNKQKNEGSTSNYKKGGGAR